MVPRMVPRKKVRESALVKKYKEALKNAEIKAANSKKAVQYARAAEDVASKKAKKNQNPQTTKALENARKASRLAAKRSRMDDNTVTVTTKKLAAAEEGRRVRNYKKGTLALRAIKKGEVEEEDYADPDYTTSAIIPKGEKITRGKVRTFFNLASSLPILSNTHLPNDEGLVFWQFLTMLKESAATTFTDVDGTVFIESEHGIWCTRMLRYKNGGGARSFLSVNKDKDYFKYYNGCPSTIARAVSSVMSAKDKPVAVLVGYPELDSGFGHAVVVICQNTPTGKRIVVKDANPLKGILFPQYVVLLLNCKGLLVKTAELCGCLPFEDEVLETDCLREGYKWVGDVLDGKLPWDQMGYAGCSKEFKITKNKAIVKPSNQLDQRKRSF